MKNKVFFILSILLIALTVIPSDLVIANEQKENNFKVCIDPGHQAKGDMRPEPSSPGGGGSKGRVTSGTRGVGTKKWEYEVVLDASLILKEMLEAKNYNVVMTRETNDINISNRERAELANKENVNMSIRIHCDSINNGGKTGATILVPSKTGKFTKGIYEESNEYATMLKKSLQARGVKVNGIIERNDLTGFNWSKVPVIVLEMGFMSNYNEDAMLCTKSYQTKLMEAVTEALDNYKTANS